LEEHSGAWAKNQRAQRRPSFRSTSAHRPGRKRAGWTRNRGPI